MPEGASDQFFDRTAIRASNAPLEPIMIYFWFGCSGRFVVCEPSVV
jgi:hypothetical protein